jgi:outer membrane protein
MQFNTKKVVLMATAFFISSPVFAVDLIGVHDLAAKNDPQLRAAAYRKEATGENTRQAWSNLLPSLSGSAGTTRGNTKTSVSYPGVDDDKRDVDTERWGLDLRQSLYAQSNYEQLDIARGQVSQADAIYNIAYQDFLVRVAGSYFAVLSAQDGVIFAEAEEKALQRQFEQAEQRFEVGLTAVTDVHEARASYDNARARAIVSRNNLADTKEGLYELTGQYFDDIDPLQEELPLVKPLPENPDEWLDIAMQYNPAILAAHQEVDIADANTRLQRSARIPTLDLTASYGNFTNNELVIRDDFGNFIGATSMTNKDTRIGLQLSWNMYQGGYVYSRTRQARSLLNAVNEDLDQQQRAVVRATNNAYRAVIAGIEQVGAFGQAMISAESALEATQAGFEVGTRTIVDVLIAQQRYFQAQRDNSVARHAYVVDHLRLKAAAGVLEEADLQKINTILK